MAQTKIKAGLFEGIIGNGADGYYLMSNGDGTMTWSSIIINPTVTSIAYPGSVTAADPAGGETITVTGTGFKTGITVTVGGTIATTVSYVSETQITFTTPAKAAGDYDIVVTNTDTGSATYINGISYNGIPSWTTATGSLGTFASDTTISTITLQASEPDAGTITFNITSGALPTGLSLTGADIDGTTSIENADTTYNFTVTATDDESQSTGRAFSITVERYVVPPLENFTINAYTGNGSTQSIEGKIDTAADFNGSASSYLTADNFFLSGQSGTSVSFSVSCWFYARTFNHVQYPTIFKTIDSAFTNQAPPFVWTDGSVIRFHGYTYADASVSLSTNTWYHLVFTQDNGNIKGYLDGSELTLGAATVWDPTILPIFMVGGSASSTTGWNGKIDQLRVFDRALSSSEVTTLYSESNTSTTKSTTDIFDDGSGVALYEFEEGANDTGGVSGYIGAGGIFNGSSSVIESTSLNYAALPTNTAWAVSCWINNSDNTITSAPISLMGGINGWGLFLQSGTVQLATDGSTPVATTGAFATLANNTWMNVVISYDGSGTTTLYYDGSFGATVSFTFSAITSGNLRIGKAPYWSYFKGKIDQVRLFNKALSSSEVTTLYGETSASSTKSTTDIFDDGSGVALYELEGNANDTGGTYNGTATNVTYAYDGTSNNVGFVGTSFQPDLVWIKHRNHPTSHQHNLFDVIRGATNTLHTNSTQAEETAADQLTSFNSNGFSVSNNDAVNDSGYNYVAWCWKAGGTYVTDTSGDLDADISANVNAGFSILRPDVQTGINQSIPHGLDSAPELIIQKTTAAAQSWIVYAPSIFAPTTRKYLYLNTNGAATTGGTSAGTGYTGYVPNSVTDTYIYTPGVAGVSNYDYWFGKPNIMYCFHSVDGYQKIGTFDGTGTTTGNIVTTGFRPRFLMWKSTVSTGNWQIVDSVRSPLADKRNQLYANLTQGEDVTSYDIVDFNDDSFQMKQFYTNQLNETYLYLAIG